jgi:hypothetical protein
VGGQSTPSKPVEVTEYSPFFIFFAASCPPCRSGDRSTETGIPEADIKWPLVTAGLRGQSATNAKTTAPQETTKSNSSRVMQAFG